MHQPGLFDPLGSGGRPRPGRGVATLSAAPAALDTGRLRGGVSGEPFVTRIVALGVVGSTNDVARSLAREGAPSGTVVVAQGQTAGRGRRGRNWHSPAGLGLYLSVLLRPGRPAVELSRWTLAAAVAACTACRELSTAPVKIDWPNDLIVSENKLGGVLAEMRTSGTWARELVLGLGLNLSHGRSDFPLALRDRSTSLALAGAGPAPARECLAVAYLRQLGPLIAQLEAGRWDGVAAAWERLARGGRGRRVRVERANGGPPAGQVGVTEGIDTTGALRIRTDDGNLIHAGLCDAVFAMEG